MAIIYSTQAKSDMKEIARFIAQNNPLASLKWIDDIIDKCGILDAFPEIGRDIGYIRNGIRVLTIKNYLVFYSYQEPKVKILRVLHGARDWESLF